MEHALNKKVADVLAATLTSRGLKVACFDYPEMGGLEESKRIVRELKSGPKPKIVISIHQNASGSASAVSTMSSTAGGTCYNVVNGSGNSTQARKLGRKIVEGVNRLRDEKGGHYVRTPESNSPANILDYELPGNPYACSVIIECSFYDNMNDILWLFRNLRDFTSVVADKAIEYLTEYNLI